MSSSVDAMSEVEMLGLADEGVNSQKAEQADIAANRKAISQISQMADRMSSMVEEIRNNSVETDSRLRQVEADLKLIELETQNG